MIDVHLKGKVNEMKKNPREDEEDITFASSRLNGLPLETLKVGFGKIFFLLDCAKLGKKRLDHDICVNISIDYKHV